MLIRRHRAGLRCGAATLALLALLVACSPVAPVVRLASPAPTGTPSASATAGPLPTAPPLPEPTATPASGELRVWHGFAPDGPEARALAAALDRPPAALAAMRIRLVSLPGDELLTRFEVEAVAGGGPDVLIAPNDRVGRQARAGLLLPLDEALAPVAERYAANALAAVEVDGRHYGLPLARSTVALYADRARVAQPPATTQALLDAARAGLPIVLVRSMYHNYGLIGAFGGRVLDERGRCVADQGGVAELLAYLRELRSAGVEFATSGAAAEARFRQREAALTINGSWLRGDFSAALGADLEVAPLPAGPAGPAQPLIGVIGAYVNANTHQRQAATQLALWLTGRTTQQALTEQAYMLPAAALATSEPTLAGLIAAAETGVARPTRAEFSAFWEPFDAALAEVLESDVDPAEAVRQACATMNQRNGFPPPTPTPEPTSAPTPMP